MKTLIIGLGNPILGDDGVGWVVAEQVRSALFNPQSPILNPQSVEVDTNVPPLERRVSLSAQQMPLKDALAEVCRQAKVELDFDTAGVELEGVKADVPVTGTIQDEPLDSVDLQLPTETENF